MRAPRNDHDALLAIASGLRVTQRRRVIRANAIDREAARIAAGSWFAIYAAAALALLMVLA